AHAGIKPGDKIIKINGEMMDAPILDDVLKKLRGPVGSKVEITIYRQETQQYITLELTREQINIQSVTKSEIIKDTSIGYIRLSKFKEKTASEVSDALKELEKQNIKGLILDLRNNTGGLLDESIKLAGLFVGPEKLVVYTKGRLPEQNLNKYSDKTYARINYPLAVLINGGSASASEVVAGAIQDHKTGTIIGENSFGKASVQSLIPLKDGSALRLTTAWYYTPNGRLIHNKGIEPDIKVNLTKEDLNIIIQKLNQVNIGELSVNDPLYVDNQVQWAIDFLKKCEQDNIQETTSK
ncbi:MAG: Carboxyl-terminal protease, partial [uncultured bacterium]